MAALFFVGTTFVSYSRWASYGYRTFDLAYYIQALWQLIHGDFDVSVQYVPLLGNHVEPIVFLLAPVFFFVRHAMLFVVVQNAALASMGPLGYDIARRLGLTKWNALLLGSALLLMPATGYIALHEFHPEALAAPFLLLMLRGRMIGSPLQHWLWLVAVLACKENMALLIAAYCTVQSLAERKAGHLRTWYLGPLVVALAWFLIATKVITPLLNAGNIDYLALYQRLGETPGEILLNFFRQPQRLVGSFWHALVNGNLVWGLFLPLLGLPLLRPKWILIPAPIFLQHLLSWRSSEWTIYFHYAAPLVPLLWFAAAETSVKLQRWFAPALVVGACIAGQLVIGPGREVVSEIARQSPRDSIQVGRKDWFLSQIPADASVTAPLPYLSHLATRRELHSLHYILKGLKTLSRERFVPPPPSEFVLIDYGDDATFDASAGYYHPAMRTVKGDIIPSSDALLHEYLGMTTWESLAVDELTLLRRAATLPAQTAPQTEPLLDFGGGVKLLAMTKSTEVVQRGASTPPLELVTTWSFESERKVFPWLELHAVDVRDGRRAILTRGLCAPEAGAGIHQDRWRSTRLADLPPGDYELEARFFDRTKRTLLKEPVSIGALQVSDLD